MTDWLKNDGIALMIMVVAIILFYFYGAKVIKKLIRQLVKVDNQRNDEPNEDEQRRADTLANLLTIIMRIALIVFGIMTVLSAIGINIAPLIAGAGIFGLAIGFGAQDMVKNLIAGFFVIIENQYKIGDVVTLAGVSGTVKSITLRSTVLKDMDGHVHYIPNGDISVATNKTFEDSKINMNIGVGYDTDIEQLEALINKMGTELMEDSEWNTVFISAPKFLRVQEFADSSVVIKITGEVDKFHQWAAEGELRKRIKKLFENHDIDIPFPQRVVHTTKD